MTQTTRERIISQAIPCIAQNTGTGMDAIARAAGVGRATLFRHFSSKAELMTAIKISAGEQLHAAVAPVFASSMPAREKLLRIVTRLIPMGDSLQVSAYLVQPVSKEEPGVLETYRLCMEKCRQLCLDLKAEGAVLPEVPAAWLVASMDSLIFKAWEMVASGDIAPKQAPWLVLNTFLAGHGSADTVAWFTQQKDAHQ